MCMYRCICVYLLGVNHWKQSRGYNTRNHAHKDIHLELCAGPRRGLPICFASGEKSLLNYYASRPTPVNRNSGLC